MSVLLFAYVCVLTAFETLSLLSNLVNKESESESELALGPPRPLCPSVHLLHVLSLLRQQHCNLSFPFLLVCCVCPRARVFARMRAPARVCVCVCMCVCVCVGVHLFVAARARPRLYCLVFIIPASVSAKLKFCIALSRLRGYCCP